MGNKIPMSSLDKILENAIFIDSERKSPHNFVCLDTTKISVIISILSDEKEYEEYGIDKHTFRRFQWHKLICPPDNPKLLSKYYGLIYLIILNAIKTGKNILIHSTETQIRAGFMLAVFILLYNKWTHQQTLHYFNKVRPDIKLPPQYIIELQRLEYNQSKYLF